MSVIEAIVGEAALASVVVVFVVGIVGKVRAWSDFVAAVAAYRVVPVSLAVAFAAVLVALEIATCGLLVAPALKVLGGAVGSLVIVLASSGVIINLLRGRVHIECGCGGFARGTLGTGGLSWWLVARNTGLLALVVAAAARPTSHSRGSVDIAGDAIALGGAVVAVILYAAASQLISNHVVMRRRRG